MAETALFWFRRDLRLTDNAALYHALKSHPAVQPIFIFDPEILDALSDKKDRRVAFIHEQLSKLKEALEAEGSSLLSYYGAPLDVIRELCAEWTITAIYANHDYEPAARKRDEEVSAYLSSLNIPFHTYKDQVIFEKDEILKPDGRPYTVFTPYMRRWKEKLNDFYTASYPVSAYMQNLKKSLPTSLISLQSMGFEVCEPGVSSWEFDAELIDNYHHTRDFPAVHGTSRLSVHLRFGTVSIRQVLRLAQQHNEQWMNELIWREFYQMILWHFPWVVGSSFKPAYDRIPWRNDEGDFRRWCEGTTGYPLVDAGMRELHESGFMHNRVRMVTASFLTKHLLIDWRWGEAWFASKLLDFELASNNGGWQWAAGSGTDAAPYFRVFNPHLQLQKFDPDLAYVRRWVPEYGTPAYPAPMVEHAFARERAIDRYKKALK